MLRIDESEPREAMSVYRASKQITGEKTLIGFNPNKKPILVSNDAKHIFVCGTTGSGKTVALSNYIKSAIDYDYPLLIIDGKGDIGEDSILDITQKLRKNKKLYVINLNNPKTSDKYNPFKNSSPTVIKDMLINMTNWSEEHYKLNMEIYLLKLLEAMQILEVPTSLKNITDHMPIERFQGLARTLGAKGIIGKDEQVQAMRFIETTGKIVEGSFARFSGIVASELGSIFDGDGIDIYTALKEKAIILFILNPLIYPEMSPLIGNLIIIDSKKAVANLFGSEIKRIFFILDEINVYASKSLLDLVNKSRSANVTCILATQSLADLDEANGEYFKEQIIENCNNYLLLRQNSGVNAEKWAVIIGTRKTYTKTYQIKMDGKTTETGLGSLRETREFLYHPDDIKTLAMGKGIFISKDENYHTKVNIIKPF